MLAGYGKALAKYAMNILHRLIARYGMDVEIVKLLATDVTGTPPS
jgi:hypothetical protein